MTPAKSDETLSPIMSAKPPERIRIGPVLITLTLVAIAGLFGLAMWRIYMESPWTRDGTVRANIVKMAPQVAGRVDEMPIADNAFVRKGDLLLSIDPADYKLAVSQAEAAVKQAQASLQNIEAQLAVQQSQIGIAKSRLSREQAALVFAQEQAKRYGTLAKQGYGTVQNAQRYAAALREQQSTTDSAQENFRLAQRQEQALSAQQTGAKANILRAQADLDQAKLNLDRTRIVSPVNGYVTNLLVQPGDYLQVGVNAVSLVDAGSFWIDGYFEETGFSSIRVGDRAKVKLMGYGQILNGHVAGIARAISVSNAQPNEQGVAIVNPIFSWVQLAQRIPVRVHIDDVPSDITLVAGMTATVEIQKQ